MIDTAFQTSEDKADYVLACADEWFQLGWETVNLIETGTGLGHFTEFMARNSWYDRAFTIESVDGNYQSATLRLLDIPGRRVRSVQTIHGDSARWLPLLLDAMDDEGCLIWLDAHEDRVGGDTPVTDELNAIFARPARHLVAVDDARLFGSHQFPTLRWVMDQADRSGYVYFPPAHDIFWLIPKGPGL